MRAKRRAYYSRNWKVTTPQKIISLFWRITHKQKKAFEDVLDMGAGDCRFSMGGNYRKYLGVEIDKSIQKRQSFKKVKCVNGCVFEHKANNFSACIGNPPYLRHNEISNIWREKIRRRFNKKIGLNIDGRSNIYVYFLGLGLQKTSDTGLVSLLIPYEWTHIPSSKSIREYIKANKWSVYIYRFTYPIFDDVLTTACISIIDKSDHNGIWKYFNVNRNSNINEVGSFTDNGHAALEYEERGIVWAMRGLSPGTKKIFTLTEKERKDYKLTKKDVRPCVTSLRDIPHTIRILNKENFQKYYVSKNKKCWLIRSDKRLTPTLKRYASSISKEKRDTWTCQNQKPWYKYRPHPAPKLLMSSAFKESGPRIMSNEIGAIAVGAAIGIHTNSRINIQALHKKLLRYDFNSKIIAREEGLKKIAIRQVNAVLNNLTSCDNGR